MDIEEIFNHRTCYYFSDKKLDLVLLEDIYNISKLGPTSANSSPLRIVFVSSEKSKTALLDCVAPGNIKKLQSAPVCAIFAYDIEFYQYMDVLFPHDANIKSTFSNNKDLAYDTAYRNSTLQAAYFMMVARSKGLGCGPISGFNSTKLNKVFFDQQNLRVNFICNLGYPDNYQKYFNRSNRLSFEQSCKII